MSKINDGGPAFPGTHQYFPNDVNYDEFHGMTLRDYFAAKAMATLIPREPGSTSDFIAGLAYEYADAMLDARGEK